MTGRAKQSAARETLPEEAERQIARWARGLRIDEGAEPERIAAQLREKIHPYIAISRQAGAGGYEVVSRVGKTLELDVIDRELLDYLAERYKLPRDMLEIVDEKACNWLVEAFGMWLATRMVSQSDYLLLLGRFVLMAGSQTSAVFVGRGVQFILPREKGLAVRIVAPLERRIERIMERQQLSRHDAKRYATKRDAGSQHFVQRHFHHDLADSLLHDLVINTENIGRDDAAEIIIDQWRRRFADQLKQG